MRPEEKSLIIELDGIRDQIAKRHFLNVHFRAFELAYHAWQQHIRANARTGARTTNSPLGAVLGEEEPCKPSATE